MSSKEQHRSFPDYVASIKKLHALATKDYQTISATLGRREHILKALTDYDVGKADKKNKGTFLHNMWGVFLKLDHTQIASQAKLAMHPLVPLSGTVALEEYYKVLDHKSDSKTQDTDLKHIINLCENWRIRFNWSSNEPVPDPIIIKNTNRFGVLSDQEE
jgi:hypothetical protein